MNDEKRQKSMGKNDQAWQKLFDEHRILDAVEEKGQFVISASQIKKFREPRLMTKFDHKINLPKVFQENNLAILPVTRGDYIISSFSAYEKIGAPSGGAQRVSVPSHLESLTPQFLVSEAIALNCASACGILADFLEEDFLVPTVSGRMGSGDFDFDIETASGTRHISVSNSQIEIDAAYEGIHHLALFEAKRDLSDDFLIRQLYYPFRVWNSRVEKTIRPIFLIFSNGTFHLYEYCFENPQNYNSLRLVKQKNYVLSAEIRLSDVQNILEELLPDEKEEPEVPFPQANSMERVFNLAELLYERPMTKDEITDEYAFDARQTNYYTAAGRYLDLIKEGKRKEDDILYQLTERGRQIMSLEYKKRQLAVIKQILKHKAFRETLKLHLQNGVMPDRSAIVEIMKESRLYNVTSDNTFERRASTITGWVNWILDAIEEE